MYCVTIKFNNESKSSLCMWSEGPHAMLGSAIDALYSFGVDWKEIKSLEFDHDAEMPNLKGK